MALYRYPKPRSGLPGILALAAALATAALGVVALFRATEWEEGDPPPDLLGIPLESAWPGTVLLVIALALAAWAVWAWQHAGSRAPRTQVASWTVQPPPGVKAFGDPPALPSHRAELAAHGVEAYPLANGEWAVRRTVR